VVGAEEPMQEGKPDQKKKKKKAAKPDEEDEPICQECFVA
jgi:hypothetical protein